MTDEGANESVAVGDKTVEHAMINNIGQRCRSRLTETSPWLRLRLLPLEHLPRLTPEPIEKWKWGTAA